MKHVKQDRFECSLAVCAMVSGADYEEVQNYAWDTYPEVVENSRGYRQYQVEEIWAEFGLPYIPIEAYHNAEVVNLAKVTLKGRGHLLYHSRHMKLWHHVAFKSGMIYDGMEDRPRRLESWAKRRAFKHGRGTICQVIVTHLSEKVCN